MPGGRHALLPLKKHDSSTSCLRAIPYRLFNSNASPKSNDNGRRVSLFPEYIPFHWLRASSSRVKGMMGHHLRWSVTYKSGKRRWNSRIRLNFVRRVGSHKSLPSCWCCPKVLTNFQTYLRVGTHISSLKESPPYYLVTKTREVNRFATSYPTDQWDLVSTAKAEVNTLLG